MGGLSYPPTAWTKGMPFKYLITSFKFTQCVSLRAKMICDDNKYDSRITSYNVCYTKLLRTNVKELIAPYLEKIKKTKLDVHQKTILSIMESNLNEITSPFARKMSRTYLNLTPIEIKVANLIRHGSNSKEISEIMNLRNNFV